MGSVLLSWRRRGPTVRAQACCCFSHGGAELERWCHAPCLISERQVFSSDANCGPWFNTGPLIPAGMKEIRHICFHKPLPHHFQVSINTNHGITWCLHIYDSSLFSKCIVSLNTGNSSLSAHAHVDFLHKPEMFRQTLKSRENIESHRLI